MNLSQPKSEGEIRAHNRLQQIDHELRKAKGSERTDRLETLAPEVASLEQAGLLPHGKAESVLMAACDANGLTVSEGGAIRMSNVLARFMRRGQPPSAQAQDDDGMSLGPAKVLALPRPEAKKIKTKTNGKGPGIVVPTPEWPDLKGALPQATCTNARVAILALGIECRYDQFHDRQYVGGHAINEWAGELSDSTILMLRALIRETFGFDPGPDNTRDAARLLCLQNQFNPIIDYLDQLKWDGINRLNNWVIKYLGADDTPLNQAIGRLILIAAVRRVRKPGCKFDNIVVLEGPEGTGKSTAIVKLAGDENFSDQTILGIDDRQQQEAVRGVWIYEIADLAGMSKADVDKIKAFASRTSDRARPAYGHHRIDLPRRTIFLGSTNNSTYLKSQTGNRRFLPLKTTAIDLSGLSRDRDQLWAEASEAEPNYGPLNLPKELWSEAEVEQEQRRDVDPWDDMLANVKGEIHGDEERISAVKLLTVDLHISADRITDTHTKRLAYVMTRLGWTRTLNAVRFANGDRGRGYCRPYVTE